MGKVGVGEAIGASVRFIGEAWTRAWGVMLLLVWVTAMLQAIDLLKPDWSFVSLIGVFVLLFLNTAATGALYRLRLDGDHAGDTGYAAHPAGFQWGGLEWRVMGANLMVGLAIGVIAFVVFFIWAIALGVILQGSPADLQAVQGGSDDDKMVALRHIMLGPGGVVSAIILVPSLLALFYLGVRLMLFTPFVVDSRSFDVGKAWGYASGAMVVLFVSVIAIFVADFIIGAIGGFVFGAIAGVSGHLDEAKKWGGAAGQVLSAVVNPPLFAGLALYVYRTQRGDAGVAATFS